MSTLDTYVNILRTKTVPPEGSFSPASSGSTLVVANTNGNALNGADPNAPTNPGNVRPIAVGNYHMYAGIYAITPSGFSIPSTARVAVYGRIPNPRTQEDREWGSLLPAPPFSLWTPLINSDGESLQRFLTGGNVAYTDDGANYQITASEVVHLQGCDRIQVHIDTVLGASTEIGVRLFS